jgi:MoaA/NifB/PqqE/SkfB family radical SAM enzyme
MISGMITNGYLLTADRIKKLNDAGLEHMQISIDNDQSDAVSKKSLKVLATFRRKIRNFAPESS